MQNIGKKIKKSIYIIVESLIIMLLLLSNSSMVIAEEIANHIASDEKAKAMVDVNLIKYDNYNIHENKGTLVQLNIKTGIEYKEEVENKSIKKSTAIVRVPSINEQFPGKVEIIAKSTKATNGKEKTPEIEYTYNKENGIVQIIAKNEEETPYSEYDVNARNEYDVICVFSDEYYTEEKEQRTLNARVAVLEELYDEQIGSISSISEKNFDVTENISSVISSNILTEDIYNGYIKSNKTNGTNYETVYKEKEEITISNRELQDKLEIKQQNMYLNEKDQELEESGVKYLETEIDKNNIKDIFGENGSIKILKEDGTVIKEINKDTEETEQGIVKIQYSEETTNIVIQTTKPIKEGILQIENTKSIPSNMTNINVDKIKTTQQIVSIKEEKITIENEEKVEEKRQEIENGQKITQIQNAQTQIDISINNKDLTNETQNNVIFNATLKVDNSKYNLFKDPELQIVLPPEVEKVVLGDVSVLYGQNLELKNSEIKEDGQGNKIINIQLSGTQNSYLVDSINNGTSIIIPATIILKKDIEVTQTKITANYTNQILESNIYKKEEKNCEDIQISIINANMNNEKYEENNQENTLLENQNDKKEQAIINPIQQETGVELQAYAQIGNKKLQNGDKIHDTEIIKYVVSIKNTTQQTIKNIDVSCQIPENTVYATIDIGSYLQEAYSYVQEPDRKEYNFTADSLEPGETKLGFYEVVVKGLPEEIEEKQISNTISTKVNNDEDKKVVLDNKIIKSKIDIFLKSYIGRDEQNSFFYYLYVTNTSSESIRNVDITTSDIQKELAVRKSYYYKEDIKVEESFGKVQNKKLQGTIPEIAVGETKQIIIEIEAGNFDNNANEVLLALSAKANIGENEIYYSNENRRNAYPEYVTVKMSLDKEGEEVKAGEEITYKLEIKNESKIRTTAHISDYLPKEVQGISLEYQKYNIADGQWGGTKYDIEAEANLSYTLEEIKKDLQNVIEGQANIDEYVEIPAGKTILMTIKAKAGDVIKTVEVSNYATAERTEEKENQGIKTVTSNIVKFTLLAAYENGDNIEDGSGDNGGNDNNGNDNNGNNKSEPYTISGVVWNDTNRDGKRDSKEELMSGITVKLYNVDNKSLAKQENGTIQKTTTDSQGNYNFINVNNGKYWVVFEYDTSKYSLTTYQKNGVDSSLNSDVISKNVAIDGQEKRVGITDNITIADNGISNIDMGLINNSIFDLKLDKYINKIQVNTLYGTKQYNYENTQFAKVEIKSKEIKDSNVNVEYKIKVTNEGDIEGYASKIVDYIPNGFQFNSSLNKGWVQDSNGNLINNTLSSEFINPGESKELTLILTKQMTGEDVGTVINAAEISESKNSSGLKDRDSIANNRNKSEDDYSEAQLLISIETGLLKYTIITIILTAILVLIGLCITGKIKPFKNTKIKNIFKGFVFMGILAIILLQSNSYAFNVKWQEGGTYYGDGIALHCADTGKHLCAVADHYYGGGSQTNVSSSSVDSVNKNVIISTDGKNVDTNVLNDNYNLIGPYIIRSNSTESKISYAKLVYTENGVVKEKSTLLFVNRLELVDEKGNKINYNLTQNVNKAFYIKVSANVEKINSLEVDVTVDKANKKTTTTSYDLIYSCTSVSGSHQNGNNEYVSVTAAGTQRMITANKLTTSSDSYSSVRKTVTFGEVNIKGRLEINKVDKTTNKPLANIGFTLKMISGEKNGQYVSYDSKGNAVYTKEQKVIKTNEQGKIYIKLLYKGQYELIETINPHYGYGDLPRIINSNFSIPPGKKCVFNIPNERKYIKISGMAWEDIKWDDGKEGKANELYNNIKNEPDDKNDKSLRYVIVTLRNKQGDLVTFKDEKGNDIQSIQTDQNGEYTLYDVEIDKLSEYYVEFIYNGMRYTSVKPTLNENITNGNKAIEGQNRNTYNNEYAKITKAQSENNEGKKIHDLIYDTSDYKSNIKYGEKSQLKYGYDNQKYPISGTYNQYLISATTQNAYNGYLDKIKTAETIRQEAITEIPNINLGIKEREQPDLALKKDIQSAKVSINNEEHIYKYADRFEQQDKYGNGYTINPQVKFGNGYGTMSYTRALYASDIKYRNNNVNELEVKIIYKVAIKNQATNLDAVVHKISDYFDSKYEFIQASSELNADGSIKQDKKLKNSQVQKYNNDYQKVEIESNLEIQHQGEKAIYVEFRVNKQNIIDIVDNGRNVKLDNISEITSYTSKDIQGNIYAGIDIDSQPDSIDINNIKTYEDDTDKAPGMLLVLQDKRQLLGRVFEDSTNEGIIKGEVRQANGVLDTNEKGISGVEVRLLNKSDKSITKIYDEEEKLWREAKLTTNENGEYTISGYIPGDYEVEYIWGDSKYKVQDYKSTTVNKESYEAKQADLQWYKDEFKKKYVSIEWNDARGTEIRVSDATDDYELREKIDEQTNEITNAKKEQIEKTYKPEIVQSEKLIDKITSTTPVFKVNVEYNTNVTNSREEYETKADGSIKIVDGYAVKKQGHKNEIKSIDFGIVERARQVLSLEKNIQEAKVILSDGNVLIDAQIDPETHQLKEYTKYASYIPTSQGANGQLKFEIDDELIQGSTLELTYNFKVTNTGELDYTTEEFYKYGKGHGEVEGQMVTLTPSEIIDYLDNNLGTNMEQNTNWSSIVNSSDRNNLIKDGLLKNTEEIKKILTSTNKIVVTEALSNQKLKPIEGKNATNITFKGYKLLANDPEGTDLNNDAEIIRINKSGGSTLITNPGNYIPGDINTSQEDDSRSESLIILPPTGITSDYIAYIVLAISSLGILVSGIILIKKYVLRK